MKRKLLSLLVLLMTAISCAWAQGEYQQGEYLYLDDFSGKTATLYCSPSIPSSGIPCYYYNNYNTSWDDNDYNGFDAFRSSCTEITVDASCGGFNGEDLSGLFNDFKELTTISGIGNLNTSNVTNMGAMFYGCGSLTTLDLSGWNTSSVESMGSMFAECKNLTTLNISNWYTGSVKYMSDIFNNCQNLSAIIGIGSLNTSKVDNMSFMFCGCENLTSLDLGGWNTASVTRMMEMFNGCSGLTSLNLSGWNTAYVKFMSGMFNGCQKLEKIYVGDGWSTESVWANDDDMFSDCESLPGWNRADPVTDVSMATTTDQGGYLTSIVLYLVVDDVDNSKATLKYGYPGDNPCFYYYGPEDVMKWSDEEFKGNVTTITVDEFCQNFNGTRLDNLFFGFAFLTAINDIGYLNTANVTTMKQMFYYCESLTTLDLSDWDTSSVTNMGEMFRGCTNLKTLDITGWDTSNVTNSTDMFTGCTKLSYDVTAKAGETDAYWATFYGVGTGYNFQAPSGTRVFVVDLDTSKDEISMIEITDGIIKSSEGVVLKSTSNSITLTPTITASTGNYTNNSLMGTLTEITPGENDYYVLNKKGAGIGFYKLSNTGTIGANKAYLSYNNPEGGSINAREFIGFEEATGLKAIDNGQLTIDNVVYDLQGRRVQNPTKGLYIVNGKKVVIK